MRATDFTGTDIFGSLWCMRSLGPFVTFHDKANQLLWMYIHESCVLTAKIEERLQSCPDVYDQHTCSRLPW